MREKLIKLYQFSELSTDKAKERARDWMRGLEREWFDPEMEPVETAAKLLGITFDTRSVKLQNGKSREENVIWWALGYCPGDGASFAATYEHIISPVNILQRVRREFPKDTKLHAIASGLAALQRKYHYVLTAHVETSGRECHKYSMSMKYVELSNGSQRVIEEEDEDALLELFRDFADWIFNFIREEYEYRLTDEAIDETIEANEYEFTEDGKRAA